MNLGRTSRVINSVRASLREHTLRSEKEMKIRRSRTWLGIHGFFAIYCIALGILGRLGILADWMQPFPYVFYYSIVAAPAFVLIGTMLLFRNYEEDKKGMIISAHVLLALNQYIFGVSVAS